MSPLINTQLLTYNGTGNITGTLDASGADTDALAEGVWAVWATQDFYVQINTATGAGFGAKPSAWPANFPVIVNCKAARYLAIKRISADGTYYANKISGPA